MTTPTDIINQLHEQAERNGQRRLLVLSGSVYWCREQVQKAIVELDNRQALYIGDGSMVGINVLAANKSKQWLGRELDFLIFDGHSGFDVDAFGAISGTLRAGGLMLLLVPELSQWAKFVDPEHRRIQVYPQSLEQVTGYYLERLATLLESTDKASVVTESGEFKASTWPDAPVVVVASTLPDHCRTQEQAQAIAQVYKVVRGHRRRPFVLTADRGRGKSAALGIAAGQLLNEGIEKIIVTAPARASAEVIFQHALQNGHFEPEVINQRLVFMAPDEIVRSDAQCDLLLVDEAAAIPTPILTSLLKQHSRIVFASTVHGYEGTGRGFAIRFKKVLDAVTPQWQSLHIHQPVRWHANDPLEAFVFQALLLNAAPADIQPLPEQSAREYEFRQLTSAELVSNDRLLNELFGLLVLAHYQTRPFDLRHMLDGGNIEIYGLFLQGYLVATVLAAREGQIEEGLIEPIWLGQRRVRGHLLPQSLSNHAGIAEAITLKGLRIIRIAVHPDRQHRGLGMRLMQEVRQQAVNQQYDYLGTSFGATPELVNFWHHCNLMPVRVGMTREAASGTHSVMMLQGLSEAGLQLLQEAQERFRQQFHWLLMDGLDDLESTLVSCLLKQSGYASLYQAGAFEQKELHSYVQGLRQYDNCLDSIKAYSMRRLVKGGLTEQQEQLLIAKVLQNKSWQEVASLSKLSGRKQAQQALRQVIGDCFKNYTLD